MVTNIQSNTLPVAKLCLFRNYVIGYNITIHHLRHSIQLHPYHKVISSNGHLGKRNFVLQKYLCWLQQEVSDWNSPKRSGYLEDAQVLDISHCCPTWMYGLHRESSDSYIYNFSFLIIKVKEIWRCSGTHKSRIFIYNLLSARTSVSWSLLL